MPKEIAIFEEHTRRSGERAASIEAEDNRATDDAFWTFADEETARYYDKRADLGNYGCATAAFHRRVAQTIREAI